MNHIVGPVSGGVQRCTRCLITILDLREIVWAPEGHDGSEGEPTGFMEGPAHVVGTMTTSGRNEELPDCGGAQS